MTIADDLVTQGQTWMLTVEAHIAGMGDGAIKTRLTRHAALVHRQMELMQIIAGENGVVRPYDGTAKPPQKP